MTTFGKITHGGGACFLGSTKHPIPGAGPSTPQFWRFPSIYAYTLVWCRTTKMITHTRRRLVFMSEPHRVPRGRAPALPNFRDSPLFMVTPFNTEPHSAWGHVSCSQPRLPSQGVEPQHSQYLGFFSVLIPFGVELPNSAFEHVGRCVFRGQPCHCIMRNASRGLSL